MARFRRRGLKRKRKSFGRKRSFKRGGGKRFAKRVKRAVNQFAEKKYLEQAISADISGISGTFYYFNNAVQQGTTINQRVGDKTQARSLRIFGRLISHPSQTEIDTHWRIIVGCWKDYTVTVPVIASLLSVTGNPDCSLLARLPLQQRKWIPMMDKRIMTTKAVLGNDVMHSTRYFDWKFSGKRLPMKRQTYTSANDPQNVYFLFLVNDSLDAPTQRPFVEFNSRFTWTDV